MKRELLVLTVLAASSLVACVSAPDPKPATAPAASNAPPAPAKIASDHQIDVVTTPEELRNAASSGYQIVMVDGNKRYCRTEMYTGSRVQKTTRCMSEANYLAEQDKAKNFIQNTQSAGQFGQACVTGTGGGAVGC